jgi:hypothetical protein
MISEVVLRTNNIDNALIKFIKGEIKNAKTIIRIILDTRIGLKRIDSAIFSLFIIKYISDGVTSTIWDMSSKIK